MSLATFPSTTLGCSAAAVVDRPAPAGIRRIPIESREQWLTLRQQDVTASALASLFGLPGDESVRTPYWLYMLKTGAIEEESDAPKIDGDQIEFSSMGRGSFLEDKATEALRLLKPHWIVQKCPYYYRDPVARLGATPDLLVNDPERGFGTVQIKNPERSVYHSDKWKTDGEFEPPLDYAIQTSLEAHLTGATWAAVGAFVVGHKTIFRLFDIPIRPALAARTRELVAEFWRRVEAREPYPPDYGRDGELIARLWPEDDGSEADIAPTDDLIRKLELREHFLAVEKAARAAEEARATIDAELRHLLKNAVRGRLPDGRIVEAKTTRVKAKTIEPYSFRAVKIKEAKAS
jgi:predicted phage-related endonuclease